MSIIKNGKLGVWSLINSNEALAVLLANDIDFVIFDQEHGHWRSDQIAVANQICKGMDKYSVLRIARPTQELVQLAQDSGCDFIQIAGVRSQADVDDLLALTKYPPLGTLGHSPWTTNGRSMKNLTGFSPGITLQFEQLDILESFIKGDLNIPQEIKSIFIGRYDLSVSMGCPGEIDNSELMKIIKKVKDRAQAAGIRIGSVSNSVKDALLLEDMGLDFISLGSDVSRLSAQIM